MHFLKQCDIIYRDYKTYSVNDKKFSVGQVLTVDFDDFKDNVDDYVKSLNEISKSNGYKISALYITNILTKNSYVIYNEDAEYIIKDAYDLDEVYQGIELNGVLSRKKQIVPNIIEVIEKL